jgi:hypothetical protein
MRKISLVGLSLSALFAVIVSLTFLAIRALRNGQTTAEAATFYEALRPGNSGTALNDFTCDSGYVFADADRSLCYYNIRPGQGQILLVTITVRGDSILRQRLIVRGIQVGDLARQWGRPDRIERRGHSYHLYWVNGLYAIARSYSWFTYRAEVDTIEWIEPLHLEAA